ncbi:MAG: hypothetical protein R3A10_00045 [Caldilineaceae bacterium]
MFAHLLSSLVVASSLASFWLLLLAATKGNLRLEARLRLSTKAAQRTVIADPSQPGRVFLFIVFVDLRDQLKENSMSESKALDEGKQPKSPGP